MSKRYGSTAALPLPLWSLFFASLLFSIFLHKFSFLFFFSLCNLKNKRSGFADIVVIVVRAVVVVKC